MKRSIISLLTVLCILCNVLPIAPVESRLLAVLDTTLYVDGVNLMNPANVTEPTDAVYYDDATHTLYLTNATITDSYLSPGGPAGIYYSGSPLNISLTGTNSINTADNPTFVNDAGIVIAQGTLTFINSNSASRATLSVTGPSSVITYDTMSFGTSGVDNNMVVECTGQVRAESSGIFIESGAELIANNGVFCSNNNTPTVYTDPPEPPALPNGVFTDRNSPGPGPGPTPGPGPGPGPTPGPVPTLYVDNVNLSDPANATSPTDSIHFDVDSNTLFLTDATIDEAYLTGGGPAGIYSSGLDLTISLSGSNTITTQDDSNFVNDAGIHVSDGTLTIINTDKTAEATLAVSGPSSIIVYGSIHFGSDGAGSTYDNNLTVELTGELRAEGANDPSVMSDISVWSGATVTANNGVRCSNMGVPFTYKDTDGVDPLFPDGVFNNRMNPGPGPGPGPELSLLSFSGTEFLIPSPGASADVYSLDGVTKVGEVKTLSLPEPTEYPVVFISLISGVNFPYYIEASGLELTINPGGASRITGVKQMPNEPGDGYSIVVSPETRLTICEARDYASQEAASSLFLAGGIQGGWHLEIGNDSAIALTIGSADAPSATGIDGFGGMRTNVFESDSDEPDITIYTTATAFSNIDRMVVPWATIYAEAGKPFENCGFVRVFEGGNIEILSPVSFDSNTMSTELEIMYYTYSEDPAIIDRPIETWYDYGTIEPAIFENTNDDTFEYYLDENVVGDSYQLLFGSTSGMMLPISFEDSDVENGTITFKGGKLFGGYNETIQGYEYRVQTGSMITVELIPDYGYQYVMGSLTVDGVPQDTDVDAQDRIATYSFLFDLDTNTQIHAKMEKTSDIIDSKSDAVVDAKLTMHNPEIKGNAKLSIEDIATSTRFMIGDPLDIIKNLAGDSEIGAVLDINVGEYISKNGTDEAWITDKSSFTNPVEIALVLDDALRDYENYRVIRVHNGEGANLEASYSEGVLTFASDKFSVFAVVFDIPATSVIYETYGGTLIPKSENVPYDSLITPPQDPTKAGFLFAGWYKDPECTLVWDFSKDKVRGEVTIYAKWISLNITAGETAGSLSLSIDAKASDIPFSAEELLKNASLRAQFSIFDPNQVSSGERQLIEDFLTGKNVALKAKALFLDLSLFKVIDGFETKVTKTAQPILISFILPEEYRGKALSILRVHDGVVAKLDYTYDAATSRISFYSDSFSTYGIGYTVEAVVKTGESDSRWQIIAAVTSLFAAAGLTATIYTRRREKKDRT